MRAEKQYLISEVDNYLKKSDYVILANFTGATVSDVADLRSKLVVVGGKNSPGVAKILKQFFKEKQKFAIKAGVLSNKLISSKDVERLADMPSLDALRAQLLGLLNQPGTAFVRVINAVPQATVNVLQAKVRAAGV